MRENPKICFSATYSYYYDIEVLLFYYYYETVSYSVWLLFILIFILKEPLQDVIDFYM